MYHTDDVRCGGCESGAGRQAALQLTFYITHIPGANCDLRVISLKSRYIRNRSNFPLLMQNFGTKL